MVFWRKWYTMGVFLWLLILNSVNNICINTTLSRCRAYVYNAHRWRLWNQAELIVFLPLLEYICHFHWSLPPRWRHQLETFSALLALCAGNSTAAGDFPTQRPVTRTFDVSFDLRLNKRLSKQSWGRWSETASGPWWRHCNGTLCIPLAWNSHNQPWFLLDGRVTSWLYFMRIKHYRQRIPAENSYHSNSYERVDLTYLCLVTSGHRSAALGWLHFIFLLVFLTNSSGMELYWADN